MEELTSSSSWPAGLTYLDLSTFVSDDTRHSGQGGELVGCHLGIYPCQVQASPPQLPGSRGTVQDRPACACKAADRRLSLCCVGAFQSAEWAVVKWLTDTGQVVDQALNDQQSRQ